MIKHLKIALFLSGMLALGAQAHAQEDDDMYFMKSDRKAFKTTAVAKPAPLATTPYQQQAGRYANPDYNGQHGEQEPVYFDEQMNANPKQPALAQGGDNYWDRYNHYPSGFDSWGRPRFSMNMGMGMGGWGSGFNMGWGWGLTPSLSMAFNMGFMMGAYGPFYDPFWGPSFGFGWNSPFNNGWGWGNPWVGGFGGWGPGFWRPVVVVTENRPARVYDRPGSNYVASGSMPQRPGGDVRLPARLNDEARRQQYSGNYNRGTQQYNNAVNQSANRYNNNPAYQPSNGRFNSSFGSGGGFGGGSDRSNSGMRPARRR